MADAEAHGDVGDAGGVIALVGKAVERGIDDLLAQFGFALFDAGGWLRHLADVTVAASGMMCHSVTDT
ncbi:hypothetical protein GCM10011610_07800 [Nocardia rhizosphaerihabitans]|uniref:Transposase n=1 Tax=Nocardia rhizosphaerihabitans TaxID=1691570 RepID=A0ABQ2K7E4_9NOCA|nr:hypothetical protein GCM10011610_07800 [Nocardia rhizosphaerihabitans]